MFKPTAFHVHAGTAAAAAKLAPGGHLAAAAELTALGPHPLSHKCKHSGYTRVHLLRLLRLLLRSFGFDDDCAVYCSFQNQTSNTFGEGTYSII